MYRVIKFIFYQRRETIILTTDLPKVDLNNSENVFFTKLENVRIVSTKYRKVLTESIKKKSLNVHKRVKKKINYQIFYRS